VRVAWYVPITFESYLALKRWERELLQEALEEMVEEMRDDDADPPPRRQR
jgi:hypothetical protein